jgi:hypothetical protein
MRELDVDLNRHLLWRDDFCYVTQDTVEKWRSWRGARGAEEDCLSPSNVRNMAMQTWPRKFPGVIIMSSSESSGIRTMKVGLLCILRGATQAYFREL